VSYILHIDTAVQTASVCLSSGNHSLGVKKNPYQQDHAAWLHIAIRDILAGNGKELNDLSAVAISAGPGSYTGLRVGMAAAKGLCYVLKIPLITVSTLQMMAAAAPCSPGELLAPMIDARRMEVFTAVYDSELNEVMPPSNLVLDQDSFSEVLKERRIIFFGNGSVKFQGLTASPNAGFATVEADAQNMIELAFQNFKDQRFADIAYTEPFYGKAFYTPFVKHSL
jgi:tRNA threonylcarbamoyladenosine biosynthesis protein TsaB